MVMACHCKQCQKLSTSAFSITATMSDWCRSSDSGNISAAKFCPLCGNRICHLNPDEPEKQDWFHIPEGVKVFDKQP
jgi:hypothetical protein